MSKICLVIIDNYQANTEVSVCFNETDYSYLEHYWNKGDVLLHELNQNGHFNNHLTWAELSPDEWYLLVAKNLELYLNLSQKQQANLDNSVVKSFNFLVLGMLKCLETYTKQNINFVKLQILQSGEYVINISSSFTLKTEKVEEKPTLQVVVDNGH